MYTFKALCLLTSTTILVSCGDPAPTRTQRSSDNSVRPYLNARVDELNSNLDFALEITKNRALTKQEAGDLGKVFLRMNYLFYLPLDFFEDEITFIMRGSEEESAVRKQAIPLEPMSLVTGARAWLIQEKDQLGTDLWNDRTTLSFEYGDPAKRRRFTLNLDPNRGWPYQYANLAIEEASSVPASFEIIGARFSFYYPLSLILETNGTKMGMPWIFSIQSRLLKGDYRWTTEYLSTVTERIGRALSQAESCTFVELRNFQRDLNSAYSLVP